MTAKLSKLQLESELEKARKRIVELENRGRGATILAGNEIGSSEMQFSLLADNMSDIIWLMDMELQVFYISPSTEKIQGYTLEELRAMGLKEQLTPESYERAMALYTESLSLTAISQPNPEMKYDIDLEFYKKDGSTYWSSNTFKFILNEDKKPIMILGVGRDITNKKLAEDSLRKSEERYRIVAEDMPAMICRFKADGTITFVNSFYCNYFNAQPEELVGSNLFLLIPEKERDFVRNNYLALNSIKQFTTYEYKAFDSNGADCWQRWTDRVIFDEQGEIDEYQSIGEDITERKQAEQQSAESESRFRSLIAHTGDLIVVIDAQGTITFASPSSERIFGYKSEEAVGKNFIEWIHPEDIAETLSALESRNKIPGTSPQSILVRGRHKDGSWKYVETLGTNLLNDPAVMGIVLNVHDVTNQQRIELEKQVIYEIMQGTAFSHSLEEFLGLVHYSIGRVLRADNFFVSLHNPSTGFFEDVYCVDQFDEVFEPSSREGTLTSYIFRTGNPLLVTDEKFKELLTLGEVQLIGVDSKSWIGVPLKTAGKTIGVMVIQDYETASLYSERELAFLASISGQVASAVERKQAEGRLHESEKRFATAFGNAPIGMALVDITGVLLKVNLAFCKFLGYSEDELTSKTFQEITHKDDLNADLDYLSQLLEGKIQSYQMEKRYHHKLGYYVWGKLAVSLVKNDENTPLYFISQIQDINDAKNSEEALRHAEEKYRTIFENSLEGIFQSTPAGRFITVNPALAAMWGYASPEDLITSITDIAHQVYIAPDAREEHMRLLKEHDGSLTGFEYQAYCKDGSVIWVSESVHSKFDENGVLLYYEGTVENISSRKQAEEDLKNRESSLQAILQSTADGILAVSAESKVLYANELFAKMWLIPQSIMTSQDDATLLQHVLNQLIEPEKFIQKTQELYQSDKDSFDTLYFKDGRVFERQSHPMQAGTNGLGRVWSFRDVTERRRADEIIKESEKRFRSLFEDSPISLWEDDYSKVKQRLDQLKSEGIVDFEAFFEAHPETTAECISLIKIMDVNQYSVKLFNAKNKEELLESSNSFLNTEYINSQELINIANGMTHFEWEGVNQKLTGQLMNIKLSWSAAPGYEEDLSKVIISIVDISDRKQAEAEISRQLSELETLYESGLAISRLLSPKEIAQKVIEILDRRMNWHHIAIRQYESETNRVNLLAFNRPGKGANEAEEYISKINGIISTPNQGLSGWVTLNGVSIRVPIVKSDSRYVSVFDEINSGVYVPIKIGERVIGSISVESEKEDAFTENDERLLETLAGQAAIAIENATLFLTTQKEITERQQAEARLQIQAEELLQLNNKLEQRVKERTAEIEITRKRLQLATDAAGLGIWEWEIATGKVQWDAQMYRIYGITPEEFDGNIETQLKFIHPEDQGILLSEAQKIIQNSETNFKIEHGIIRKDNKNRRLLEQAVATFDQRGFLENIIGIVDDITPQKKAEQDLRESEAYARKLFDASPDPISVSDTSGVIIDINRLFEQQHQIQREEVQGRHISELNIFPPEQLVKFNSYMMDILKGKDVSPVELIFNHPDGAMHTLEMNSYPIEFKSAQLILSTTRDITVHKKAEDSLRVANAEMERALRIKDEFLANMSHELRTPLNAVLGMAESLEEQIAGPLNEKQIKYIRTISESGRHLLELINDILDLSKIEAGRLELNISQVSVTSLCEASMRMVKEQALKKNQTVSLTIDPEVKHILGDERRLKQALVNLLSNAVKFTPNDQQVGVEVKGNIRNQTVTFTVWDKGIGMAPEELKLIFKPFVQLDAGLAREFSGTGLGLVLVAQMIRLHGGSVSVESKQGQGSRFSITLPWVDVSMGSPAKALPQKTESGANLVEKRNEKILIVEDTDSIIMLLSEYLRYKGYQILIARNGMEGVNLARKEKPDLILMDVMMPVMNGVEATEKIRAEKDLLDIPIIALTALAMAGDRERCLKAGMNDYLSKPVQMKELENLILKHLQIKNAPPT